MLTENEHNKYTTLYYLIQKKKYRGDDLQKILDEKDSKDSKDRKDGKDSKDSKEPKSESPNKREVERINEHRDSNDNNSSMIEEGSTEKKSIIRRRLIGKRRRGLDRRDSSAGMRVPERNPFHDLGEGPETGDTHKRMFSTTDNFPSVQKEFPENNPRAKSNDPKPDTRTPAFRDPNMARNNYLNRTDSVSNRQRTPEMALPRSQQDPLHGVYGVQREIRKQSTIGEKSGTLEESVHYIFNKPLKNYDTRQIKPGPLDRRKSSQEQELLINVSVLAPGPFNRKESNELENNIGGQIENFIFSQIFRPKALQYKTKRVKEIEKQNKDRLNLSMRDNPPRPKFNLEKVFHKQNTESREFTIPKVETEELLAKKEEVPRIHSGKIDLSHIENISKKIFQPGPKLDSSSKNKISQQSNRNRKSNEVMKNVMLYNQSFHQEGNGESKQPSVEKNLIAQKTLPVNDQNFTDRLESEINKTTDRFLSSRGEEICTNQPENGIKIPTNGGVEMNRSNDVIAKDRFNKFTGNPMDIELGTIDEKERENVTDSF
jgi:hypothetical protein